LSHTMQIFYSTEIEGDICRLDKNESSHCLKVLRLREGSSIKIVDGYGNLYEGIISVPDIRNCEVRITDIIQNFESRRYRLHIAISPLKNTERFEWFTEKCVEIGIDEITPLICHNTEKPGIRYDRVNNIILSAMKQSIKAFRPVLNKPVDFSSFVRSEQQGVKMIPTCSKTIDRSKIDQIYSTGDDAVILIGPEGDFTVNEIDLAISSGYKAVHLGTSRLRAETAGVAACYSIYNINQ
jgi:16S rRNA (uracil1498-N3)-methyltransferase